jgi:hypothetical protein
LLQHAVACRNEDDRFALHGGVVAAASDRWWDR